MKWYVLQCKALAVYHHVFASHWKTLYSD